jgi:lipopolysaccharide exporter
MSRGQKSFISGILLVINALANKMIGLISTLILARVLTPEDFGLVAITTLVLGFVSVFATTESQAYIFQKKEVTIDVLNTAWSLDLILKAIVSIFLLISAPFVAEYYGNQELTWALLVIASHPIIMAMTNPGIWFLQKEQNFGSYVKQSLVIKIMTVSVTITSALLLKNYWALIIGMTCNEIFGAIGSYRLHKHRPKFCLRHFKDQFAFSVWMTPKAIIGYLRTQLDTFIVSSAFGKSQLGSYHVMKYIAFIPTLEILGPGTQPLLAELAKVREDPVAFAYQYRLTLSIVMLVALPMACFMFLFDEICIQLLLGKQWLEYAGVFGAFSGLILSMVLLSQLQRVLTIFEQAKEIFYIEIVTFISIYGFLFFLANKDILLFTQLRVALELGFSLLLFLGVTLKFFGWKQVLVIVLLQLPLWISTLLSGAIIKSFDFSHLPLLVNVALSGILYSITYLLLIWISYLTVYRKTAEGQHVKTLVVNIFSKMTGKKT